MKTFAWYLNKGLFKAIMITCALAWVIIFIDMDIDSVPADRPNAVGSPAALVEDFNCWTDSPNGKVPGHVVMRTPDGDAFVGNHEWVAIALDQHMNVTDTNYHIYAFCP